MKCPVCIKEGEQSTVESGLTQIYDVYCHPYHDEDGVYHHHDTPLCTDHTCSRGHRFHTQKTRGCPAAATGQCDGPTLYFFVAGAADSIHQEPVQ